MSRCLLILLWLLAVNMPLSAQVKPPAGKVAWVNFGVLSQGVRVKYHITPQVLERYWFDDNSRDVDSARKQMTDAKWQQSRFVIDSIPALLLTAGATTSSWGCLHCHDQPVVMVEVGFKDNQPAMYYHIDSDTIRIPASLRRYVKDIMEQTSRLIAGGDQKKQQ